MCKFGEKKTVNFLNHSLTEKFVTVDKGKFKVTLSNSLPLPQIYMHVDGQKNTKTS